MVQCSGNLSVEHSNSHDRNMGSNFVVVIGMDFYKFLSLVSHIADKISGSGLEFDYICCYILLPYNYHIQYLSRKNLQNTMP